jgi:hypothetical protein
MPNTVRNEEWQWNAIDWKCEAKNKMLVSQVAKMVQFDKTRLPWSRLHESPITTHKKRTVQQGSALRGLRLSNFQPG